MTIPNLTKMAESYLNGLKTLWENGKLLITSNFSFSHSVFKRLVSQGRQKVSLSGNGLITIQSLKTSLENAGNQHFILFPPNMFSTFPICQNSFFESHFLCCLQMLSIYKNPKFCYLAKS